MFGGPGMASSFSSPPGGIGFSPPQPSVSGLGSIIASPGSSSLGGIGLMPTPGGSGSPVFQSPAGNRFPTGGGAIVFTPHSNASPIGGGTASAAHASPFSYVGGSASSFVQSPTSGAIGSHAGTIYSPPPYSSTMMPNLPHHPAGIAASPITHGYGPPAHFVTMQPYGYGSRAMAGMHAYHPHQNPYQHHQYPTSPYFTQHSPRDQELVEPMHCSPIGQPQTAGSPLYQQQQMHRSPGNNPPPRHMPAYLTGIDLMATVQPRQRRVFDRSPSTSPPAPSGSGGRSPQSKSPNTWNQPESVQSGGGQGFGSPGQIDANTGLYRKRMQGQGPSRQLRFQESQIVQETDEKEKRRSGPPIIGFGASEEASNFLNSPLLNENNEIVPGAAIAREAVLKYSYDTPIAESNWVTVFGFPAAAASFIYTNFALYGSIVQSKCNPGGNWLHIQYASRIDARKALACNGKVLGGSIMVGVISSPREVIEAYEKLNRTLQGNPGPSSSSGTSQQSSFSSSTAGTSKTPLQERNVDASSNPSEGLNKGRPIRPLAGSSQLTSPVMGGGGDRLPLSKESAVYMSPTSSHNENVPIPTASTGIITKAMEYMFGW